MALRDNLTRVGVERNSGKGMSQVAGVYPRLYTLTPGRNRAYISHIAAPMHTGIERLSSMAMGDASTKAPRSAAANPIRYSIGRCWIFGAAATTNKAEMKNAVLPSSDLARNG